MSVAIKIWFGFLILAASLSFACQKSLSPRSESRPFFTRGGKSLPVTKIAEDYKPGDVVSWDLNGKGLTHIGLVSNFYNESTKRYLIIHNIGAGAQAEDVVFDWKITGHFRYF